MHKRRGACVPIPTMESIKAVAWSASALGAASQQQLPGTRGQNPACPPSASPWGIPGMSWAWGAQHHPKKCKFRQWFPASESPIRVAFEQKVKRFLMFGGICWDTCKFSIRPGHHLPMSSAALSIHPHWFHPKLHGSQRSVKSLHRQERCFRKSQRDTKTVPGQRETFGWGLKLIFIRTGRGTIVALCIKAFQFFSLQ